jgi:hypothetical protein
VVKARYGKGAGRDSCMIFRTTGANETKLCKILTLHYFDASNRRLETGYQWRGIVAWPRQNHFVLYWQGDDGQIRLYDGMNKIQILRLTIPSMLAGAIRVSSLVYKRRLT